jgi:prepilin-type N-terminal cleavage/methylation domain-containing protein
MEIARKVSPRRGFTLLELLVVIAVIGLLFSMLLPAIQRVREQARMVQCKNHLHQISLAAANYESQFGVFPNRVVGVLELPTLHCPSDSGSQPTSFTSYRIDRGSMTEGFESDGYAPSSELTYRRARDITDGLSQTVAYSEKLIWPPYAGISGLDLSQFQHDWIRLNLPPPEGHLVSSAADAGRVCEQFGAPPIPMDWWNIGDHWFTHVLPPNSLSCNYLSWPVITATSEHPGGVHVALADGAVRFISEQIDRDVWKALGTRAGGEAVTGDY